MSVFRVSKRIWLVLVACLAASYLVGLSETVAQRPNRASRKGAGAEPAEKEVAAKPAAPQKRRDDDKTKPQAVDIETDDGVMIAATYFPSTAGRNSPVVMLLHGYGEKQRLYDDLAFALQDAGIAVLTFDFRGHGFSTSLAANPARGAPKPAPNAPKLDFHDLGNRIPWQSLLLDVEACKRFLVLRNNAGELNLGKLGVVGSEMGATIAVQWSHRDWQYPSRVGFGGKQGQDVQTLVLISPTYNFKGMMFRNELAFLEQKLPLQVVVGKRDARAHDEAKRIYDAASRARRTEPGNQFTELDTKLQGLKLLNPEHGLKADEAIVKFLGESLKSARAAWEERETGD